MQAAQSTSASASTSDLNASVKLESDLLTSPGQDSPQAEPSSGVHRTQSSLTSGAHRDTDNLLKQRPEKRKRSRVTPEQLVELEKEFSKNRTPTGAQRKAISERLGMQERQTQIWFQNRRAKAKLQDQRPPTPEHAKGSSSGIHLESYIAHLIREKDPVTLIPCSDLKIGHWTRINPSTLHHEVLAYTSQARQCITWFIRSSGLSFKIEVPFSSISKAELIDVKAPQLVTLVLELHTIPLFFVQQPDVRPRPGETMNDVRSRIGIAPHLPLPNIGATPGEWVASNDWTQNQQASRVLRHELTGPRTSIIPGVQSFPKELGLLSEDLEPQSSSQGGIDLTGLGDPIPAYDAESPYWSWNDSYQIASAATPSSASGYETSSTHSSIYTHSSNLSVSSLHSGSQSVVSSTRATPAVGDDFVLDNDPPSIAQPAPLHHNLSGMPFMGNPQQGSTTQSQSDSVIAAHNQALADIGFSPFDLTDPSHGLLSHPTLAGGMGSSFGLNQSQPQMGAHSMYDRAQMVAGSSIPANSSDLLAGSGDIIVSRYAQQRQNERRQSEAALMAQQGTGNQPFVNLGMLSGLQDFTSFGGQDFSQNNNGTINLGFEVDTSLGNNMGAYTQGVNTYPSQPAGFDDTQLYLQQSNHDPTFTGLSGFTPDTLSTGGAHGINQFTTNPSTQTQLLQQQAQSQGQALGSNSADHSRRSSMYGYQ